MITSLLQRASATTQRSGVGLVSFLKECRVAIKVGKHQGMQPKVKKLPYYMDEEYIAEVRAYADDHDITMPADPTDW